MVHKGSLLPRGFPLERVNDPLTRGEKTTHQAKIGVWQGMVDGAPDVDAIFRLTVPESPDFNSREPFHLAEGVFFSIQFAEHILVPKGFSLDVPAGFC